MSVYSRSESFSSKKNSSDSNVIRVEYSEKSFTIDSQCDDFSVIGFTEKSSTPGDSVTQHNILFEEEQHSDPFYKNDHLMQDLRRPLPGFNLKSCYDSIDLHEMNNAIKDIRRILKKKAEGPNGHLVNFMKIEFIF